jgi:transcriptional regulator with XRE-family HTH domain
MVSTSTPTLSPPSLEALIEQIFARCQSLGWTQTKLAQAAGVARESVSRLRHRSDVDFSLLEKLCNATGLTIQITEAAPLKLSFPYNWSNSAMNSSAIIHAVLERGIFLDIVEVARYFGIASVKSHVASLEGPAQLWVVQARRMVDNIERGFELARSCKPR